MATVFIPSLMQKLSDGQTRVEVEGSNVRQIVDNLDAQYPASRSASSKTAGLKATSPSPSTAR